MQCLEQIWQTEVYSAHVCRVENNIFVTKAVFLNTNHISSCFHFESFNEKIGKLQGKHLICSQFFTGGVFVFSANSSPTIIWFLQIFGEHPGTQRSWRVFLLSFSIPCLL